MLRRLYLLLPALLSFVAALAACLPWGAPAPVALALPMLAMAVIFFWTLKRQDQLPSPVVFLIGLFTDLATAGPLGYWALNFLIAVAFATLAGSVVTLSRTIIAPMGVFASAVAATSLTGWIVSSLFFLKLMPLGSFWLGGALAILAYPAVNFILEPLDLKVGLALAPRGDDEVRVS